MVAPGGGVDSSQSTTNRLRRTRGPVKTTKPGIDGLVSLSYFINGKPMDGFNLINLRGPFFVCLNYYFMESTIRLLSDFRFRAVHARHMRIRDAAPRQRSSSGDVCSPRDTSSPPGMHNHELTLDS